MSSSYKSFNTSYKRLNHQRGVVLMVMLIIMVLGVTAILTSSLSGLTLKLEHAQVSGNALSQAKEALIGSAATTSLITSAGYLNLPDLGFIGSIASPTFIEGQSVPNFSGNYADYSLIGKVPWKTLGISPSHDVQGGCPWYIVSGRFKNTPVTSSSFNWDTLGQIDVIDGNGNNIASNIAALLVTPGPTLDGQNRSLSDPAYKQCGGNYDARNYLDSYNNSDAITGELNYFASSANNRIAPDNSNKRFVLTSNAHYNDHFLFVTTDDIFRPIIRRSDFIAQINSLLNDSYFTTASPSSTGKGADNINCSAFSIANQTFCTNWKEMLLFTSKPSMGMGSINAIIDGVSHTCNKLLIFSGQKTAAQVRLSPSDKANPANYIEGQNLTSFAIPTTSGNFSGKGTFDPNVPNVDILKCL